MYVVVISPDWSSVTVPVSRRIVQVSTIRASAAARPRATTSSGSTSAAEAVGQRDQPPPCERRHSRMLAAPEMLGVAGAEVTVGAERHHVVDPGGDAGVVGRPRR